MPALQHAYPFDPSYGYGREDLLAVDAPLGPADFEAFWRARHVRALAVDPLPELTRKGPVKQGWQVHDFFYRSTDGATIGGCVDGIWHESFYCWWAHPSGRVQRHKQFEDYILSEMFPFMEGENPHPCVIPHGCSMGVYQAANLAFRHPRRFEKLVAFFGRYDLTWQVEAFGDLLESHYEEQVYFHMPTHFLGNLECHATLDELRRMDIVLVIGEEDPFRENNEDLCRILDGKGIHHRLHYLGERAHRGHYWRQMVPLFV